MSKKFHLECITDDSYDLIDGGTGRQVAVIWSGGSTAATRWSAQPPGAYAPRHADFAFGYSPMACAHAALKFLSVTDYRLIELG